MAGNDSWPTGPSRTEEKALIDPVLVPCGFNILVLVPVGLPTLLGGATGNRWVFHGKFPESSGVRTNLGSLWTSILAGSCLGLYFPTVMAPLLLIQVAYKSLGSSCSCSLGG